MVGKRVYASYLEQARDKLASDPFNPELIEILTEAPLGIGPGQDTSDRTDDVRLAKLAFNVAPYDPEVWRNVATLYHSINGPTDPTENAFFENSMVFSNLSPVYFFEYLSAKRADLAETRKLLDAGELLERDQATIDSAVICPLIRLVRINEMMCNAVPYQASYLRGPSCNWEPEKEIILRELLTEAAGRNACEKEINSDPGNLFNLTSVETDIVLPDSIAR